MALKFGTFMAPFHCPVGQDPTVAYERDLNVLKHMDMLGFEEAWIGEHHSCGHELIPDPMIFIAYAANHVPHMKLGAGVVSLPYHNPLWVADRALFLDRLLRGRFMLGLGPGALPTDATMIGISLEEQRTAFEDDVDVLMATCSPRWADGAGRSEGRRALLVSGPPAARAGEPPTATPPRRRPPGPAARHRAPCGWSGSRPGARCRARTA